VHQRHRQQTDRQQTDNRQTTDGRLIAYSERNVVRSLIKLDQCMVFNEHNTVFASNRSTVQQV